jgi:vitamin K-dependent gamma-carboxylase
MSSAARFAQRLFAPVDLASLAVFRMAFGVLMTYEALNYLAQGWVRSQFIAPEFHFTYFGFAWVHPWPGEGMIIHFWVLATAAFCIALGLFYRIATVVFFAGFTRVFLIDAAEYLNHFYLICLVSFLLMFLPSHKMWSLDALRNPALRSNTAPTWSLWLLRAQVGMPYFFGGIAKLNSDWLHGEPLRMWLAKRSDYPFVGHWFTQAWTPYFFSYSGLLLDLSFVPLLLWWRTRLVAFALVLGFNLINSCLFTIGVFPWLMIGASLLFFPPDWPRKILFASRRLLGVKPQVSTFHKTKKQQPNAIGEKESVLNSRARFTLFALALYLGWQCLMPLRHWLYPGDVNWTEEGHNFSWHMKLRDKQAEALFTVTDPATRRSWQISPEDFLTPRQWVKMTGDPDLLHQFALHLAEEFRKEGFPHVEVRVHSSVRLNGREAELLIDPNVNLAAEPRSLRHSNWINPLTKLLPVQRGTKEP